VGLDGKKGLNQWHLTHLPTCSTVPATAHNAAETARYRLDDGTLNNGRSSASCSSVRTASSADEVRKPRMSR